MRKGANTVHPQPKYVGPCRHDKLCCKFAASASVEMGYMSSDGTVKHTRVLCYMGPESQDGCYKPDFTPAKRGQL